VADAIEAAGDLTAIAGVLLAIGLLAVAVMLLKPLKDVLDFNIPYINVRPLHFLAVALERYVIDGAEAAIKALEGVLAGLFYGLVDSLGLLIGVPVALGMAIKDALVYLWRSAIHAFVNAIVNPVRSLAQRADAAAVAAEATAARDLGIAERYAEGQVTRAVSDVKAWATHEIDAAKADTLDAAYRSIAVVRAAEDAAISSARAIAVGAEDALHTVEGAMTPSELAALLASIPALAVLVHAIATEAGLDNSECRGKVKQVCCTDPSRWAQLLLSIAALGLAFDLRELVAFAKTLVSPVEDLIKQAA
jgi:hypothetical protein